MSLISCVSMNLEGTWLIFFFFKRYTWYSSDETISLRSMWGRGSVRVSSQTLRRLLCIDMNRMVVARKRHSARERWFVSSVLLIVSWFQREEKH